MLTRRISHRPRQTEHRVDTGTVDDSALLWWPSFFNGDGILHHHLLQFVFRADEDACGIDGHARLEVGGGELGDGGHWA